MSQFQPPSSLPPAASSDPAEIGGQGMVIAALICAIIGFVVPLLSIIAILLAILALVKPAGPGRGKGFPAAVLVIAIVATIVNCAGVLVGIMLPALGQARQAARQAISASNVRQVGVALHMYAGENQNWFPESHDGLSRLTSLGLIGPEMLISPRTEGAGLASYVYVPVGVPLDKLADPSNTIVVYEDPQHIARGDVNVLFADGSVRQLSGAELNQQLSQQRNSAAPAAGEP